MKVRTYVHVMQDGAAVVLKPGDTVPEGVTVSNPAALDGVGAAEVAAAPSEGGAGAPGPDAGVEPADEPAVRVKPARRRRAA